MAKHQGVILDIDEDFFGVADGAALLPSIPWEHVAGFNKLLASTFRIESVIGENQLQ